MNRLDGGLRSLRFRYRRRRVVDPFGDLWRRCPPSWSGFGVSAGWTPAGRLVVLMLLVGAAGLVLVA